MQRESWIAILVCSTLLVIATVYAHWVRYPELRDTPPDAFVRAHESHTAQYGLLIGLPFVLLPVLVLATAIARPARESFTGLALLAIAHGITLAVSAPCHARLATGFDAETMNRLMASNWPRLIAWSLLAALSAVIIFRE
ncbi:MAG: hypothetical protein SFX74_04050 [Fimbriimonadaceae bacterium]|nr:hypothetical protein [Fimbriimonadaceae bacterium]